MAIRVSSKWDTESYEIIKRLRGYRAKVAEHQACKEVYDDLFPNAVQALDDMPKGGGCDVYEPERWAIARIAHRDKMHRTLHEMREAYADIERLIEQLEGYEKVVLIRRYCFNESFEEIGEKIRCHKNTARAYHSRAIERLREAENRLRRIEHEILNGTGNRNPIGIV